MDNKNLPLIKMLIIGDTAVGKSSIMTRFCDQTFNPEMLSTIGIDYKSKIVSLDGQWIKIQIWDTAGQERFRSITTAYYRGTGGIMIVYDITQPKTFANVKYWLDNILKYGPENVPVILVGNKLDKVTESRCSNFISHMRGQSLADSHDIPFFETSALDDIGINQAILTLAKRAKRNRPSIPINKDDQTLSQTVISTNTCCN
jgi:small GTP-binding protein